MGLSAKRKSSSSHTFHFLEDVLTIVSAASRKENIPSKENIRDRFTDELNR